MFDNHFNHYICSIITLITTYVIVMVKVVSGQTYVVVKVIIIQLHEILT